MSSTSGPGGKSYLINDVPLELFQAAREKSKQEHVPLRSVVLAILCAWTDGEITLRPGARRKRRGFKPGRSVHLEQAGTPGETVIQPQRFTARLQAPRLEPQPVPAGAPASVPPQSAQPTPARSPAPVPPASAPLPNPARAVLLAALTKLKDRT